MPGLLDYLICMSGEAISVIPLQTEHMYERPWYVWLLELSVSVSHSIFIPSKLLN